MLLTRESFDCGYEDFGLFDRDKGWHKRASVVWNQDQVRCNSKWYAATVAFLYRAKTHAYDLLWIYQSHSQRPRSFWSVMGIGTSGQMGFWVRKSRTSGYTAQNQGQTPNCRKLPCLPCWTMLWVISTTGCYAFVSKANRKWPWNPIGQGSRFFQRMTKGAPGDEVGDLPQGKAFNGSVCSCTKYISLW